MRYLKLVVLLLICFILAKSELIAQVNITASSVSCSVGQDVEIPISVNAISGATQLSMNIPYASNLLYLSTVITAGSLSNGANVSVNALAGGKTAISVSLNRSSAITGNGVLFRLKGKCIGQGMDNSGIRIQTYSVNGTVQTFNSTQGSVNVTAGNNLKVWVDPKGRVADGQYAVDIKISNPEGWGIYSYVMELTFPVGSMRATNYISSNTLSDGMFVAFNNNTPGVVVVSSAGTKEMKGNAQLLLRINVNQLASTSASIPVTIRKFEIDNGNPKPDISNAQWNPQVTVSLNGEERFVPQQTSLGDAFPNPFNPSTTIPVHLTTTNKVTITIHDAIGRIVDVLLNDYIPAGRHEIRWNSNGTHSGVYLIRMNVGDEVYTKRVTLIK